MCTPIVTKSKLVLVLIKKLLKKINVKYVSKKTNVNVQANLNP